jgi:limonene-1,2-epoxide hydrolase
MDAEGTVNQFIDRVVAGDLTGAAKLVSEDLEYDNVPIGKNIGREALVTFLGGMTKGIEELEFVVHRQTCTGNVVMNERSDRFRIGDRWIDLPVVGVFEVDGDGLIALWRDYFDMKMFADQMAEIRATS